MTPQDEYLAPLSPDNAAVLFIDNQTSLMLGTQSIDTTPLRTNTEALAKLAAIYDLPVVLTTTGGGARAVRPADHADHRDLPGCPDHRPPGLPQFDGRSALCRRRARDRAVMAGTASGEPKGADGAAESLRALRVARRSAVKARTQAANQLHALLSTAPDGLREGLRGLPTKHLAAKAARFRCGAGPVDPTPAVRFAMRSVSHRHRALSEEIAELEAQIERLAAEAAPELVALDGVGPDTAATLLVAAGDNPERLRSEAAFAHLCGAAPVRASSGKTVRHRLNPGGNRDANRALHVVALNRLRRDDRTRAYVARRTVEGKSKREAMRCLKRYIVREAYRAILLDSARLSSG